ncbi:DNA excision repair protein ERCC-5 homolog isoform X2 [Corticium candelabrum]|uniref:DNA excision repair protein ERCC-5 homolog isoform X2 n=1 Tax=Corticium candelabrum TaxID=121492 RepID=UPI002E26D851|nr:DNA excision repair protein ERCC-5 homolog isoform X2 [Corticium candelabrum]
MGVHGLWQLLESAGQSTTLESLEGKVLAVDISLWLHQFVHGMVGSDGTPVNNGHLIGLFNRICKLLFFRIKPVFVFDGGVPALKQQTMALRRLRRGDSYRGKQRVQEKLLMNYVRSKALETASGSDRKKKTNVSLTSKRPSKGKDVFELPSLPSVEQDPLRSNNNDSDEGVMAVDPNELMNELPLQDLNRIDVNSSSFKALPLEIQHELIIAIQNNYKVNRWNQHLQMPQESDNFSDFQLDRLLYRGKLTQQLEAVRKLMNSCQSRVSSSLVFANSRQGDEEIISKRVVSEDLAHFILVKGSGMSSREESQESQPESESDRAFELVQKEETNDSITVLNSVAEDDRNNIETVAKRKLDFQTKSNQRTDSLQQERPLLHQEPVSQCIENTELDNSRLCNVEIGTERQISVTSELSAQSATVSMEFISAVETDRQETSSVTSRHGSGEAHVVTAREHQQLHVVTKDGENTQSRHSDASTSSDEFIDVPSDINDDEAKHNTTEERVVMASNLFPLSVFQNKVDVAEGNTGDIEKGDTCMKRDTNVVDNSLTSNSVAVKAGLGQPASCSEQMADRKDDLFSDQDHECHDSRVTDIQDVATEIDLANDIDAMEDCLAVEQTLLQKEKAQYERHAAEVTNQMYADGMELLRLFGVPYIQAPMEAEAQCAWLDETEQTEGTITDDSDIFLVGGKRVFKNLFNQNKYAEVYRTEDIYSVLGLDRQKMIDLAFLLGSDYTPGIQGVGTVAAMEILSYFSGTDDWLVNFKEWWEKANAGHGIATKESRLEKLMRMLDLPRSFPDPAVRRAYVAPTVDESREPFQWAMPDLDSLRDFAANSFNWTKKQVDQLLLPVMQQLNKMELVVQ